MIPSFFVSAKETFDILDFLSSVEKIQSTL